MSYAIAERDELGLTEGGSTKSAYQSLAPKFKKFVRAYVEECNFRGPDAIAKIYPRQSKSSQYVTSCRLLKDPKIQQAILEIMECNRFAIERDIRVISKADDATYSHKLEALDKLAKVYKLYSDSAQVAVINTIQDDVLRRIEARLRPLDVTPAGQSDPSPQEASTPQ